ncbi:MAG TPA: hypothetical protein VGB60_01230 [Brevundimonas sp.]|uniref:hypothetical protein n=1 Tax=Brevundimonas sp. TaxID=1871086 RepID=UPI002ED8D812
MSKRLDAMRANPSGDWRIADVEALCREHGVLCEPARGGSSHYKIAHAALRRKLSIPFARPIKPVYIRDLVRFDELHQ